jgi:hypothetical protein
MGPWLTVPHRPAPGMCPVNGIRDLVHWRAGRDWSNEFVHGLGQGGGFAYLRFAAADPPRQVYWGVAGPRQHKYLAELLGAGYTEIENRSFKFSWARAQAAVDAGNPPVIGPLDMFYLPFYQDLYHRRHIPIHYLLLVGHDQDKAYVFDTGISEVQALALDELVPAWDVNVPGLGKRNRLVVLEFTQELAPTPDLVRKAITDQCRGMLHPPVSMLGVPAMAKVAREIAGWPAELGDETAARCLLQVREYLNSPPDLEGDNLTAGRHLYVAFLREAARVAGVDLSGPIGHLQESLAIIPRLAGAIRQNDLAEAAACFGRVAEVEASAYSELAEIVDTIASTMDG